MAKLERFSWLIVFGCWGLLRAGDVNLALAQYGGMPSSPASTPIFTFSPQKACDGKPETAWVSEPGRTHPQLDVEWRFPVIIRSVRILQAEDVKHEGVGRISACHIELQRVGTWAALPEQQVPAESAEDGFTVALPGGDPVTGIRLVIDGYSGSAVAVSEFEAVGESVPRPREWLPGWSAGWIWCSPSLRVPHREPNTRFFRRSIEIDDPAQISEAWVLAAAFDRLAGVWLNGHRVLSAPSRCGGALCEATIARIPLEHFVPGENVLSAQVDDLYEVGSQCFLAEFILVLQDGSRQVIKTDREWLGRHDRGRAPDWMLPGLDTREWYPCQILHGANGSWHTLWNVPYPVIAPVDTAAVKRLSIQPSPARPGDEVTVDIDLSLPGKLSQDYAAVLRLGQPSFWRNHDFDLVGLVIEPEALGTSAWEAGEHRISLKVRVPEHAPADMPATFQFSVRTAAVGLSMDAAFQGRSVSNAYGMHFSIPVVRDQERDPKGVDAPAATNGFPLCEVRTHLGNPALFIDGKLTPPILWSSSYGNYRKYHYYASSGVTLFRPVLEGTPIPDPAERESYFAWWFREIDRMINAALAVNPELHIMPALTMDPHPQWLFDSPSEQMQGGRGSLVIPLSILVPDRGQVRPTFMSKKWRRDGAAGLQRLVKHMGSQPYADRIIGICLFAGRAGENYWGVNERNLFKDREANYDCKSPEEWECGDFSMAARRTFREFLLAKYGTAQALSVAWKRKIAFDDILDPAAFDREEACNELAWSGKRGSISGSVRDTSRGPWGMMAVDYWQCFSEAMIDSFDHWAGAVKEASGGRLLAGCYYGYALAQVYTAVPGFHGHTAVTKAAQAANIDFFVSPSEYDVDRRAGGHFFGLNIIDSLRLHNKLWIYEADTRTYLAEWLPKTYSREETVSVIKRDAAAAMVRGSGWWWYEFAKGQQGGISREWFLDDALLKLASDLKGLYMDLLNADVPAGPSAEIAVLYHGESLTAQSIFAPTAHVNIPIGRMTFVDSMQRIGAPFDFYNLADTEALKKKGLLDQYRLCIVLNAFFLAPGERELLRQWQGAGRTVLWLWGAGLAGPGQAPDPANVTALTGIPGIAWSPRAARQVQTFIPGLHPILTGVDREPPLDTVPFHPDSIWAKFGNDVWPLLHVNPNADSKTEILSHWVIDGKLRKDMGALCVRGAIPGVNGTWRSILAAIPQLTPQLLRNVAATAGVHIYWPEADVLFAGRQLVAVHTGPDAREAELKLPLKARVTDALTGQLMGEDTDNIRLEIPPFTTRLLRLSAAKH